MSATPIAVPVQVVWTVTASGQSASVTPATPMQVSVAQVHLGLRGNTGDMHPGIPLLVQQAADAAEAAETSANRVDLGALDQAVTDAETAAEDAEDARFAAVEAKEAAEAAALASGGKVNRSGDVMDGYLEGPAGAMGNQFPRAIETVRNVGGAARMPSWTTAGRPAAPGVGDRGRNTDLGCSEEWSGTAWEQDGWQRGAALTLAGTATDAGPFPAWANEIEFQLALVSTNGTAALLVQLGDAGGVEATGYEATSARLHSSGPVMAGDTTGFRIEHASATPSLNGVVRLARGNGNTWDCSIEVAAATSATFYLNGGGIKTLSDVLTTIRFTTVGYTQVFDGGTVTPRWRK